MEALLSFAGVEYSNRFVPRGRLPQEDALEELACSRSLPAISTNRRRDAVTRGFYAREGILRGILDGGGDGVLFFCCGVRRRHFDTYVF